MQLQWEWLYTWNKGPRNFKQVQSYKQQLRDSTHQSIKSGSRGIVVQVFWIFVNLACADLFDWKVGFRPNCCSGWEIPHNTCFIHPRCLDQISMGSLLVTRPQDRGCFWTGLGLSLYLKHVNSKIICVWGGSNEPEAPERGEPRPSSQRDPQKRPVTVQRPGDIYTHGRWKRRKRERRWTREKQTGSGQEGQTVKENREKCRGQTGLVWEEETTKYYKRKIAWFLLHVFSEPF